MLLNQGGPDKELGAQQAQLGSCPPAGRRDGAARQGGSSEGEASEPPSRKLQRAPREQQMAPPRAWRGCLVVRDRPGVWAAWASLLDATKATSLCVTGATCPRPCPPPQQPGFPFCEAGLMVPSSVVR